MADAPTADPQTAPSQPASFDSPDAALDAAIADLGAKLSAAPATTQDVPEDGAPAAAEDRAATTDGQPADTAPEPDDDEGDAEQPAAPQPGGKPSRLARVREQLTAAEQRAQDLEAQLSGYRTTEAEALRKFVGLVLPDAEFEQLRLQAEQGDWSAREKLDTARAWRQMAAPLYEVARGEVLKGFAGDFGKLRDLDGMDADRFKAVAQASDPIAALREMHGVGRKAAAEEYQAEIAALKAEVRDLKTRRAASGLQPAGGGGQSPARGTGLDALRDPTTGLLTDEAQRLPEREVRARLGLAA